MTSYLKGWTLAPGLFVWRGVTPVSPEWFEGLRRRKLISVTAIPMNGTLGFSHARLPLDAVHNMQRLYRIDENRIYVSGFSAGAGMASRLKQLASAVCEKGTNAGPTDQELARRWFAKLDDCGAALDQPDALKIVQLTGPAIRKLGTAQSAQPGK